MDLVGTRLGRYEIQERIGKGGMAVVYRGWDRTLERPVAVKVLHDYLLEEQDFRNRFEREAKVVASLDHPNIVQVYDFEVTERGGQPICYMVMKYIPGQSLKALMEADQARGERLTMSEIANVMNGVCSALQFAHSRGMVHRDVTPGNILFDEQGRAVLADFGIARIVNSQRVTQSGTTSGTPLYMSPEQGLGQAGDQRSDLYSLGVILYELVTGRAPFEGDSAFAVLLKHINDPVPSPLKIDGKLPSALEPVLFRALAKDPDERYQTATELLMAFESVLDLTTATRRGDFNRTVMMSASSLQPGERRVLAGGRQRWLVPAVGGLAALLLIGIGLVVQSQRANSEPPTVTLAVRPFQTRFAPSMTSGPVLFTEAFDDPENLRWPLTADDPDITRQIANGEYHITHRIPAAAVTTLFYPGATYGTQYVYEADFRITDAVTPDTATGIVFRFRNDDNYYVFAVNGMGQVSLWSRFDGQWRELRGLTTPWTDAPAAKRLGQVNRLRLIDDRRRLLGYVNEELVIEVQDTPRVESGSIGVYLASSTSPLVDVPFAEVYIDNYNVTEFKAAAPTAPASPAS